MKTNLLMLALCLFATGAFAQKKHVNKIELQNGTTTEVKNGDTTVLSFGASYYDGGYSDSLEYDSTMVKFLGDKHTYARDPREYIGYGGDSHYNFLVKKNGTTTITLWIFQSFNKAATITKYRTATLFIN